MSKFFNSKDLSLKIIFDMVNN